MGKPEERGVETVGKYCRNSLNHINWVSIFKSSSLDGCSAISEE